MQLGNAMLAAGPGLFPADTDSEAVRLRTLILLRWMAIAGQLVAITVAWQYFGLQLPLGLCFAVVGAAIVANLVSIFVFPESKRLTEGEAMLILLFDLTQLSFLLHLTGGLTNPFALLILAPVVISASALRLRTTLATGLTSRPASASRSSHSYWRGTCARMRSWSSIVQCFTSSHAASSA